MIFAMIGTMAATMAWFDGRAALRVGGEPPPAGQVERTPEGYRCGACRITTPLPEGYPGPTAPGAIEIKRYPSVRRAEVTRSGSVDWGMNGAFWPLFRHIQRRDIEMTSPVEMDYPGMLDDRDARPSGWTMSFLYRTADLGPTGSDGKSVVVVDTEPLTVVAAGFRGSYSMSVVRTNMEMLEQWLADQSEWERAGEARALHYNGPEQRARDRWGEVQIPVRRRSAE
ncbi:MAG TPA: ABC transporter substrate-binding protein [Phycisphaerales bacterium]|nr:ABC transporter substrate-binding protein [Phycisphaerales bacterium]